MESFLREGEPWNLMVRKGVVYQLRTEASAKPSAGPVASETLGRPSNLVFRVASRADHSRCWTHWCWPQSSSGLLSLSLHHDSWSAFLSRLAWTPLVKEASAQHPRASFRGSRGVYLWKVTIHYIWQVRLLWKKMLRFWKWLKPTVPVQAFHKAMPQVGSPSHFL